VHILIAEDNRSDVFLIREALRKSGVDAQIMSWTTARRRSDFSRRLMPIPPRSVRI
jgi:hypothetical protein